MLLLGIWRDHPTACLVVCSLVACVLLLVRTVRRAGRLGHIPGPWYARYSGLCLLAHEFFDGRTKYIHSLHQIYGDVVLVGPAEVSFASCLAGKQIYHDRQVDKSSLYAVYAHLERDSLFSTRRHDAHRRRRRVVGNYYARSRLPVDLIIKKVDHSLSSLGEEEEEMYGKILGLTVETITAVVFRSTHAPVEDDDDMRRSIADRQHRDRVRLLRMRGYPLLSFLLSVLLSIFNFGRKTAKEEDVITKILGARDEKNGLFATLLAATNDRAYALSETRDHLIAGSDTTTTVLVFLLHHLAFNDSLQEILHASLLQNDDLETNPDLDAILKEALRLWAPIPMSLPRVSSFDKLIDGFLIPAKTRMSSSAYSRHRLPHLFPDPETFNHERFLRVDDDDDDDAISERERGLWAFSSGTRVCIGKALAMLEMKLLIGRLIRAYRLAPGEGLRRTLVMVENCEAFGAGPGHQANIHIRFVRR